MLALFVAGCALSVYVFCMVSQKPAYHLNSFSFSFSFSSLQIRLFKFVSSCSSLLLSLFRLLISPPLFLFRYSSLPPFSSSLVEVFHSSCSSHASHSPHFLPLFFTSPVSFLSSFLLPLLCSHQSSPSPLLREWSSLFFSFFFPPLISSHVLFFSLPHNYPLVSTPLILSMHLILFNSSFSSSLTLPSSSLILSLSFFSWSLLFSFASLHLSLLTNPFPSSLLSSFLIFSNLLLSSQSSIHFLSPHVSNSSLSWNSSRFTHSPAGTTPSSGTLFAEPYLQFWFISLKCISIRLRVTFGRFAAFLVGCLDVLQYVFMTFLAVSFICTFALLSLFFA
jgi:hypothetical protein